MVKPQMGGVVKIIPGGVRLAVVVGCVEYPIFIKPRALFTVLSIAAHFDNDIMGYSIVHAAPVIRIR